MVGLVDNVGFPGCAGEGEEWYGPLWRNTKSMRRKTTRGNCRCSGGGVDVHGPLLKTHQVVALVDSVGVVWVYWWR